MVDPQKRSNQIVGSAFAIIGASAIGGNRWLQANYELDSRDLDPFAITALSEAIMSTKGLEPRDALREIVNELMFVIMERLDSQDPREIHETLELLKPYTWRFFQLLYQIASLARSRSQLVASSAREIIDGIGPDGFEGFTELFDERFFPGLFETWRDEGPRFEEVKARLTTFHA